MVVVLSCVGNLNVLMVTLLTIATIEVTVIILNVRLQTYITTVGYYKNLSLHQN